MSNPKNGLYFMLKINAVKLEINTTVGLFEANLTFNDGLNIIRGDNSTGKSSMFQAILYGLGLEELLGSKNANTMQYVLRDHVNYDKHEYKVLQSFVYLEFTNRNQVITTKRSVVCQNRLPQLVEVIKGAYLTQLGEYPIEPMWVHDSGGASNITYGFHHFLEKFLDWNLPEVTNSRGENTKLYLQQIAPSFILEQKTGWSHFLATMPYYNIRNPEGKSIEFLLDLDVGENEKSKRNLNIQKQLLTQKWVILFEQAKNLSNKGAASFCGFEDKPSIVNNASDIFLSIITDEQTLSVVEYLENLRKEYIRLENIDSTAKINSDKVNEKRLQFEMNQYNQLSLQLDILLPEITQDKELLKNYHKQLVSISEDLRKNKDLLKLNKLGASVSIDTAYKLCPLCRNDIDDSLLPEGIEETPMSLEENISYLDAQKKMIEVYIEGQRKRIQDKETQIQQIQARYFNLGQSIRLLKKELIADDRLPSELDIENKLKLKLRIDFYVKLLDDFDNLKQEIIALSKEWIKILSLEKKLPSDFYSSEDRSKINKLETSFLSLLKKFNYSSQSGERIRISMDKYLPVVETHLGEDKIKQYDIKYDSSGSDFVRAIWAYTCALKKVSDIHKTNHPKLLMLDEPQQQSASIDDFRTLLAELSSYKEIQVLVFASFNNSDEDYTYSTQGLDFNLNHIIGKIVKPVN